MKNNENINNIKTIRPDATTVVENALESIGGELIRAINELDTNVDDIYNKLEQSNQIADGRIEIEYLRKLKGGKIKIRDYGEGFTKQNLERAIFHYGKKTSAHFKGFDVRGLWSRGLKEAIIALGRATLHSINGEDYISCQIWVDKNKKAKAEARYTKVTNNIRKNVGIRKGNGVLIDIDILEDRDIKKPQFDTLAEQIQDHYELRKINQNPKRKVIFRSINSKGKVLEEKIIKHVEPSSKIIIQNETFYLDKFPKAKINFTLKKSHVQLSNKNEKGDYALAGILVTSKNLVLDNTLFKWNADEHASYFFGEVNCDYIKELRDQNIYNMKQQVITRGRTGAHWKHPFLKELESELVKRLDPIIQRQKNENLASKDKSFEKKMNQGMDELEKIAKELFGQLDFDGLNKGKSKKPNPENGFAFSTEYFQCLYSKSQSLRLYVKLGDECKLGSIVKIKSEDQKALEVLIDNSPIQETEWPDIGVAVISLVGHKVGSQTILTATYREKSAKTLGEVIEKRKNSPTQPKDYKGGFFNGYELSSNEESKQRSYFDRDKRKIVIYTKHPVLRMYFDPNAKGADTAQGQVLLAEVVADTCIKELIRYGIEKEKLVTLHDSVQDSIQSYFIKYYHQFAHRIHTKYVDLKNRKAIEGDKVTIHNKKDKQVQEI